MKNIFSKSKVLGFLMLSSFMMVTYATDYDTDDDVEVRVNSNENSGIVSTQFLYNSVMIVPRYVVSGFNAADRRVLSILYYGVPNSLMVVSSFFQLLYIFEKKRDSVIEGVVSFVIWFVILFSFMSWRTRVNVRVKEKRQNIEYNRKFEELQKDHGVSALLFIGNDKRQVRRWIKRSKSTVCKVLYVSFYLVSLVLFGFDRKRMLAQRGQQKDQIVFVEINNGEEEGEVIPQAFSNLRELEIFNSVLNDTYTEVEAKADYDIAISDCDRVAKEEKIEVITRLKRANSQWVDEEEVEREYVQTVIDKKVVAQVAFEKVETYYRGVIEEARIKYMKVVIICKEEAKAYARAKDKTYALIMYDKTLAYLSQMEMAYREVMEEGKAKAMDAYAKARTENKVYRKVLVVQAQARVRWEKFQGLELDSVSHVPLLGYFHPESTVELRSFNTPAPSFRPELSADLRARLGAFDIPLIPLRRLDEGFATELELFNTPAPNFRSEPFSMLRERIKDLRGGSVPLEISLAPFSGESMEELGSFSNPSPNFQSESNEKLQTRLRVLSGKRSGAFVFSLLENVQEESEEEIFMAEAKIAYDKAIKESKKEASKAYCKVLDKPALRAQNVCENILIQPVMEARSVYNKAVEEAEVKAKVIYDIALAKFNEEAGIVYEKNALEILLEPKSVYDEAELKARADYNKILAEDNKEEIVKARTVYDEVIVQAQAVFRQVIAEPVLKIQVACDKAMEEAKIKAQVVYDEFLIKSKKEADVVFDGVEKKAQEKSQAAIDEFMIEPKKEAEAAYNKVEMEMEIEAWGVYNKVLISFRQMQADIKAEEEEKEKKMVSAKLEELELSDSSSSESEESGGGSKERSKEKLKEDKQLLPSLLVQQVKKK